MPEACTLPTTEQPLRVAEFDELFAESLVRVQRISETEAGLVLRDGPGVAEHAQDLADRETACCSFFTFILDTSAEELVLRVAVPASQTRVLAALADRAEEIGAAR